MNDTLKRNALVVNRGDAKKLEKDFGFVRVRNGLRTYLSGTHHGVQVSLPIRAGVPRVDLREALTWEAARQCWTRDTANFHDAAALLRKPVYAGTANPKDVAARRRRNAQARINRRKNRGA